MIKEEEISRSQRIYIRALDRSIADVKKVILKKKRKEKRCFQVDYLSIFIIGCEKPFLLCLTIKIAYS